MSLDTMYINDLKSALELAVDTASLSSDSDKVKKDITKILLTYSKKIKNITGTDVLKSIKINDTDRIVLLCNKLIKDLDLILQNKDNNKMLKTSTYKVYHNFRSSLAAKEFKTDNNEQWPTAYLSGDAIAQFRPPTDIEPRLTISEIEEWKKRMYMNVFKVDDLTADVFDIVNSVFIEEADNPNSDIDITADDILRMRGVQPKITKDGELSVYRNEQRDKIAEHIGLLDNIWVSVDEFYYDEVVASKKGSKLKNMKRITQDRALIVSSKTSDVNLASGGIERYEWKVRPGNIFAKYIFAEGRPIALLSQKALKYDPYRQIPEKRLARFFSWGWGSNQGNSNMFMVFTVAALLEEIRMEIPDRNSFRIRERLELALQNLTDDKFIGNWQYEFINEDICGKKGWIEEWFKWVVIVSPPQSIIESYTINAPSLQHKPELLVSNTNLNNNDNLALKFGIERKKRGLTFETVALQIGGISSSRLSRIEKGETPSPKNKEKIEQWLSSELSFIS